LLHGRGGASAYDSPETRVVSGNNSILWRCGDTSLCFAKNAGSLEKLPGEEEIDDKFDLDEYVD
jgi:hypothetical protein